MREKAYKTTFNRASKIISSDKSINPHLYELLSSQLSTAFSSCVELIDMDLIIENIGGELRITVNALCCNNKQAKMLP